MRARSLPAISQRFRNGLAVFRQSTAMQLVNISLFDDFQTNDLRCELPNCDLISRSRDASYPTL